MVLLDTNVVSEWARPLPEGRVREWLNSLDEDRTFISVVTVAEIRRGILLLPAGVRRARLTSWFEDRLLDRFGARCLSVDKDTAFAWAKLTTDARSAGTPLDIMDAFIAATASVHHLTLATRNTRHFLACGIALHNPWNP